MLVVVAILLEMLRSVLQRRTGRRRVLTGVPAFRIADARVGLPKPKGPALDETR
jgi:hypothetical protein